MNPLRSILHLASGDFVAKGLTFVAFIYLARVLGVDTFGALEFGIALLAYATLVADAGLELWAMRSTARGEDLTRLAGRVVGLRTALAFAGYGALAASTLIPTLSGELRPLLLILGLTLFANALNLKWVFMGLQQMRTVAGALVAGQIVFALLVFALVREPAHLLWVAWARVASDAVMAAAFLGLFRRRHGPLRMAGTWGASRTMLRGALPFGVASTLAIMSFNFDLVFLGFFLGTASAGLYAAAYKPVTAILAGPISYFVGLFPTLSKAYAEDQEVYRSTIERSFRLLSMVAAPVAVGGFFLAEDAIGLLFGPRYEGAVAPLQILVWAAAFTIMRGTFRQGLIAAGRHRLDLRCAVTSVSTNVVANVALIPTLGLVGAALATALSEFIWLAMAAWHLIRHVVPVAVFQALARPVVATAAMAGCLALTPDVFWLVRGAAAVGLYGLALFVLGEPELHALLRRGRPPGTSGDRSTSG